MPTARPARIRAALSLSVLLGAGALLAACGGSSTDASTGAAATAPPTTAVPPGTAGGRGGGGGQAALQAFRDCMSQHGVTVPAGGSGGGGPNGSVPRPPGSGPRRSNGSTPGTAPRNGDNGGAFPGLDMSDPNVQSALAACRDQLPAGRGNGNGTPGTGRRANGTVPPDQ